MTDVVKRVKICDVHRHLMFSRTQPLSPCPEGELGRILKADYMLL